MLHIRVDAATLVYAALVGLYLPFAATRTKARLAQSRDAPARAFRRSAAAAQALLLVISAFVAVTHGIRTLPLPATSWPWLAALPALGVIEGLRWLAWTLTPVDDRRNLWVRTILPSRAELPEWIALTLLSAVAEEIAYRGLLCAILAAATGSLLVAALLSAVSFGAAHAPQGLRSQVIIAAIGLVLQGLVVLTGSLVPAMAVHFAANVAAGIRGPKRFRDLDAAVSLSRDS